MKLKIRNAVPTDKMDTLYIITHVEYISYLQSTVCHIVCCGSLTSTKLLGAVSRLPQDKTCHFNQQRILGVHSS